MPKPTIPRPPIRKAEIADLPAIVQIERSRFSHPWKEHQYAEEIDNPLARLWVAEESDLSSIAGYILFLHLANEIELLKVAVAPEWSRCGIGESLLRQLLEFAREKRVLTILLEVRATNEAAIALYTKLNFHPSGRRRGYYTNPPEDALLFRRDIQLP